MLLNAQKLLGRYIDLVVTRFEGERSIAYFVYYLNFLTLGYITFMCLLLYHCITWDGKTVGHFVCFFILLRIRKKTPVLLSSTRKTLIIRSIKIKKILK